MRNSFFALFLLGLIFVCNSAYAFKFSAEMCKKYGLGSSWYCEEEKRSKGTSPDEIMQSDMPPEQKSEALNQLWESQRRRAVITGDKKDLENLLVTQKYIAKLGADFARNMMRVVETSPLHSVSQSYYQASSDEHIKAAHIKQTLEEAKERYAIAFVYSSNCPYCKRQLPVLLSLQEEYKLPVIGISVDGGFYKGLSQNIHDPAAASDPSIVSYPTIMLLDSASNKRIFIAKGLSAKDQIEQRIYRRITEITNSNRGKHAK